MLLWEFTVTFHDEVNLFWTKKANAAVYLFFWNRYYTIGLFLLKFFLRLVDDVSHDYKPLIRCI